MNISFKFVVAQVHANKLANSITPYYELAVLSFMNILSLFSINEH